MTLDLAAISLVLSSNRQVPAMEYPPTLRKHLQDLEEEVLSGDGRGSVHVRRKNSGYSALTRNSSESTDWASSEQPVTAGWEEDGEDVSNSGANSTNVMERLFAGNLAAVALAAHALMLVFYLVLFVIYHLGVAIWRPFSAEKQVFVNTWLTVALQCFGVAQTTLMLFCAQQLAIRSSLLRESTVTSLHDVSQSWSGLGSAIGNLYRQFEHCAAISAPVIAFLYLAGIAGLHITTPALFGVQVFEGEEMVPVKTYGTINWTQTAMERDLIAYYPQGQAALASIQQFYQQDTGISNTSALLGSPVGLYGGYVYAVPEDNKGVGNITVDAVHFGVQCGETVEGDIEIEYLSRSGEYKVGEGNAFYSINLAKNTMIVRQSFFTRMEMESSGLIPHAIYILSTTPILDASQEKGNSTVNLDPPMNYTILGYAYDDEDERERVVERRVVLIPSFQVLKCTLIPQRWTLDVDPVTKLVLPGSKLISPYTARYFEPLNPEQESPWIPTKGTEFEHDATLWRDMFNDIPHAPEVHIDDIVNASCSQTPGQPRTLCGLGSFTTMDDFLMASLGVYPDFRLKPADTEMTVRLEDVEEAMTNASAAMYWAEISVPRNQFKVLYDNDSLPTNTAGPQYQPGEKPYHPPRQMIMSQVNVSNLQARVHLNLIPLAAGFSINLVLLLLLFPLIHWSRIPSKSIHGLGVLDIVWLALRYTEADWEKISRAPVPSTENLRRLGTDVSVDFSRLL